MRVVGSTTVEKELLIFYCTFLLSNMYFDDKAVFNTEECALGFPPQPEFLPTHKLPNIIM